MLSTEQRDKINKAYQERRLRVKSVSPSGNVEWKRVWLVQRAEVTGESIWEAKTEKGPMVLTGGHRVFTTPTTKIEMEKLQVGQQVLGVEQDQASAPLIRETIRIDGRAFMYDLTAEDWHNFVLHRSGVVISNSPDKHYHFRPPEHEGVIGKYNRVFGQVWEDSELLEYLERALDWWNMFPPSTNLCNLDRLLTQYPAWGTAILWGAIVHAAMALSFNWIQEEFSVAGDTSVRVFLPDDSPVDIQIAKLYALTHDSTKEYDPLRQALVNGDLRVMSVDPSGVSRLSPVRMVLQHQTPHKNCVRITLSRGALVTCTRDHSLFEPAGLKIAPVEAGSLHWGSPVVVVHNGDIQNDIIVAMESISPLEFTYDLAVPGDQNFVLSNGVLAHNSYSIGGISLDIERSSKYESMKSNAESQFDKATEAKLATVKFIRGLQQPKYGVGIRSSFGPAVGRGVLSPRNFL